MAEAPDGYDHVAREVIEQALGRTFEDVDSIPRRDIFIRDATDVLSQFVAARCGNPGFHSARFFDAVVALSAMKDRIKEAARGSKVVERVIEAQRKLSVLEQRLRERDGQMTALAKGDAAPVAKALAEAEERLAQLEEELAQARHVVAEHKASDSERLPVAQPASTPDPGRTARLPVIDEESFFEEAEKFEQTASGRLRAAEAAEARAAAKEEAARAGDSPELELVELERDALRAQLEQIVEREKSIRAERNTLKAERDELASRAGDVDAGRATEVERERDDAARERDDAVRARTLIETAKKTLDQELAVARSEIQGLKQVVNDRDSNRSRSVTQLEDAVARAKELEETVRRESRAVSRTRRELDDIRADRDRLRSAVAELLLLRDLHRELLSSLGVPQDLEPQKLLDELARRRELVFVHEPPAWDEAARGLEHVRDHAPTSAAGEARARLSRQAVARVRYESLRGATGGARGSATDLLELAKIVAAHEEDLRWVDAVEALVAGNGS